MPSIIARPLYVPSTFWLQNNNEVLLFDLELTKTTQSYLRTKNFSLPFQPSDRRRRWQQEPSNFLAPRFNCRSLFIPLLIHRSTLLRTSSQLSKYTSHHGFQEASKSMTPEGASAPLPARDGSRTTSKINEIEKTFSCEPTH